jgi:hypothetical protein
MICLSKILAEQSGNTYSVAESSGGKQCFAVLARCARYNRATVRPEASLILRRGLTGPRSNPPGQRALPFENPNGDMLAISAWIRLAADEGALAGAADAPWGALFAAMRGSGLTCSDQPARPLDGARADALSVCRPPLARSVSSAHSHNIMRGNAAPHNCALHNRRGA